MAPPWTVITTSSCSLLLMHRPRKDERLSWPSWLTYSGRFTHISGHPSTVGRTHHSESSPVKDQRSTSEPRNRPVPNRCNLSKANVLPLSHGTDQCQIDVICQRRRCATYSGVRTSACGARRRCATYSGVRTSACGARHRWATYSGVTAACCGENTAQIKPF